MQFVTILSLTFVGHNWLRDRFRYLQLAYRRNSLYGIRICSARRCLSVVKAIAAPPSTEINRFWQVTILL